MRSSLLLLPPPRRMLALMLMMMLVLAHNNSIAIIVSAFAPHSSLHHTYYHGNNDGGRCGGILSKSSSSSSLQMAPIFIIGPMIRRMRENQQKKNLPMANPDESKREAPGLRVGSNAWKWPPVWPYDTNFFKRKVELEVGSKSRNENAAAGMKGLLTGAAAAGGGMNTSNELEKTENGSNDAEGASLLVFDSLKYWSEQKNVLTELDSRVAEKITNHYSFYLQDGMSILELGAAEKSYLPSDLKLKKHVGIGAVQEQMDLNPSLTSSMVLDLNDVIDDVGLRREEEILRTLLNPSTTNGQYDNADDEGFDAIIMANTIDFLISPREVFKTAWRALKPGGIMMVPFLSKDAYADKFDEAFTKQWRDMTDDQHMWVCGSFFQFSAGEGWEGLKGFDISPEDAKKDEGVGIAADILAKLKPGGDYSSIDSKPPPGAYLVQARKQRMADRVDEDDVEGYIKSRLWMMPTLEDRDKKLVAPRLARAYDKLDSLEEKERMVDHLNSLPNIYASLIKMDQFAFTFSMQAQLAADLVGDPSFEGNDVQINNMKMGLGLRKPSKDFWAPVGRLTAAMTPEDKVNLLAYIVPRFGTGDAAQDEALAAFASGLEPTFAVIRSKCPNMKEGDVQLLGSELLAAEILIPGRSTREQFAAWLGAMSEVDLQFILTKRKSYKEDAKRELKSFQEEREAEEKRVQERREKIQEQVMTARENRSVIFNPRTGKMEEYEEKKGFQLPF